MARRAGPVVALTVLMLALSAPADAQTVAGGTLDLGQPADGRSVVAARSHAAAVALVPGERDIAAVGEPAVERGAGRVRIVPLANGVPVKAERSEIAGPARDARAGRALATVHPGLGGSPAGLLVGVPRARVAGRGRPGAAFLIIDPGQAARLRAGHGNVIAILGAAAGDRTGSAVASMPDFDGDNLPELLIGAPGADPLGREDAGTVYVVPSHGLGRGDTVDLAEPGAAVRIDGAAANARTGAAVAGSLDENGDGLGEAVAGAPGWNDGAGAAYVVRPVTGVSVDLASVFAPAIAFLGTDGERAGAAVATPRDMDRDGVRDLPVGAPLAVVDGRRRAGAVYVVPISGAVGARAIAQAGIRIVGEARSDRAGSTVAQAGDVIGNGNPDLMIGATRADPFGRWSAGAVYVVSGEALDESRDLGALGFNGIRLAGQVPDARAGAALAADVDVGGDDDNDIVIGTRPNRDAARATTTLLVRTARLAKRPDRTHVCDARPVSMILDVSGSLAEVDDRELRGQALEMLLEHPSAEQRVVAGVEAAQLPGQVFTALVPGDVTNREDRNVRQLVDESLNRTASPGDLTSAVATAVRVNPDMLSALVVAGPDVIADPANPAAVPTDVVGVGIPAGSPLNATLRDFAVASRGEYRRVRRASRLQRWVARFDAERRCESRPRVAWSRSDASSARLQEVKAGAIIDEDRPFADAVVTWQPGPEPLKPYAMTVEELDGGSGHVEFTRDDVQNAIDTGSFEKENVTLVAGVGDTFFEFRVDFNDEHDDEPEPQAAPKAQIAKHRRHWWYLGGGSRSPLDAYVQFFQPRASD